MVNALRSKALVLLIFCFCINLTVAERWPIYLHRRDGPTTPSTTSTDTSDRPSSTASASSKDNGGDQRTDSTSQTAKTSASATTTTNSTASSTPRSTTFSVEISAVPSSINGAPAVSPVDNISTFNSTLTPHKLPITPEIDPGFAVGGVLLMLSGVAYTLIGIKNRWLHIYLSAAYLASLSVTVLIIYVMNPPVSNAIQGAYVVAIVMTGVLLGGAAIVFKEMTEGLGCLLGGFCLSMWLLVLKPGGLLTSTGAISGFIAAFTLVSYAFSFSHITRPYGLIFGVSFGGATVIVLGIDCFSRAGLKEFWAYLWKLNDNLFPVGATTYPLTRGLRVEIAAIIIIFLAGIVSQMKLWKVIKERREQRAAERLEDERTMEQEEENVGRRIEDMNAKERNQWETVYGDKDQVLDTPDRDSGVGDMESKKGARSTVTSLRRSGEEVIEMGDMSPTLSTGAGLVMTNKGQDGGPVTIRVARDVEVPHVIDEFGLPVQQSPNRLSHASATGSHHNEHEESVWVMGADGEARLEKRPSQRKPTPSKVPVVVPLPFKVPEFQIEDDHSSVATFADDDQAGQPKKSPRLSGGSSIFKKMSKRSQRNSRHFSRGESTEDLVIPHDIEDDRASSVAATMDGMSDDDDMRSVRSVGEYKNNPEETVTDGEATKIIPNDELTVPQILEAGEEAARDARPISTTSAISATKALEQAEKEVHESAPEVSLTSSTDPKAAEAPGSGSEETGKDAKATPSVASAPESKPSSITKDRLPAQLSKVVMSYRTNEWAKHLGAADAPDLENLTLEEYPAVQETTTSEVAAPVNVEELQQTPTNAQPPPARSTSQLSNYPAPPITRSGSSLSKHNSTSARPGTSNGFHNDGLLSRSVSQQSLRSQQGLNARGLGARNSTSPNIPQPIVESPIEDNYTTAQSRVSNIYVSSSTLMGKRDTMVRNKSSYFNHALNPALASTPELSTSHFQTSTPTPGSDAGSIYATPMDEDENMPLSARRDLIRQSSLQSFSSPPLQQTPTPFDTHQPRRQSSAPSPLAREQQLATWRASVQNDFQSTAAPRATIERQRSALWLERQAEEQKRVMEQRRRGERDSAFDERMRRGDMLDAHREALRRMQAAANKHT